MKYIFLIFGTIVLILVDALSKHYATLLGDAQSILIPHILSLRYVQNTGIAFSLPLTGMLLKIITVILIFGIFWYYWHTEKPKKQRLLDWSYVLIFAGALGNAWERILRGYVTDFIALEYFSVFNLADAYISIGALGILYFYYFSDILSCQTNQDK